MKEDEEEMKKVPLRNEESAACMVQIHEAAE